MNVDDFEKFLGIKAAALIAGALGGIVQLSLNPKLSVAGGLASVFAGSMSAGYLGPVISAGLVHAFGWPLQAEGALNFLIGLLGMQLMAKLYAAAGQWKFETLADFVLRVLRKDK